MSNAEDVVESTYKQIAILKEEVQRLELVVEHLEDEISGLYEDIDDLQQEANSAYDKGYYQAQQDEYPS